MNNLYITKLLSRISVVLTVLLTILVAACDTVHTEDESLPAIESARKSNGRASLNAVYTFADFNEVGSSILRRNPSAIQLSIETSELEPDYAYTVWWLVFDRPEYCSAPGCGEDDVFEDALAGGPNKMELSILGAADGSVVSEDGTADYRGLLRKYDQRKVFFGDGLDYPMTAEVHYVIRSHGPAIPGLVKQQISTFNGGCDAGQPNEGLCEDVQFSVHLAPGN